MKKIFHSCFFLIFITVWCCFFLQPAPIFAQENVEQLVPETVPETSQDFLTAPPEETLEAIVTEIIEEGEIIPEYATEKQFYQKIALQVTKGSLKGQKITIENSSTNLGQTLINVPKYQIGNQVIVTYTKDFEGNDLFYITDYIRRDSLFWLFLIFIILAILVARWRGLLSLLGMGISFLIIFKFILPQISAGADPALITIIGSLLIIPITFFLSHGWNKKTLVAIAGTLIALIITGLLANYFTQTAKLTGFASEEANFLQVMKEGTINIKGLLLAGIIIGVLGVLDDITISQSAIVFSLKKTNPQLKLPELYKQAMDIGQDHISSMINTLILVYTGAALPLLLLFLNNPHPFEEIINYEIVADEAIRTLVGSIGLILAVPITTVMAVIVAEGAIAMEKK